MSFGYLPWPLLVLVLFISAVILLVYVLKNAYKELKTFTGGLIFISFGSVGVGIYKYLENTFALESTLWLVRLISLLMGFTGFFLICVAAFLKVKHEPYKKRMLIFLYSVGFLLVVICGLIIIFLPK